LFFRGRFKTLEDVRKQVELALSDNEFKDENGEEIKLGNGNPLIDVEKVGMDNCPIIALNRYHIPNKKFWNNVVPSDVENPYKASAAVRFSIRVHFRDDFAYIDFGCPWSAVGYDEQVSHEEQEFPQPTLGMISLLRCHFISKDDANTILQAIVGDNGNVEQNEIASKSFVAPIVETCDFRDEEGTLIENK
jgi:hypothetical protein